MSTLSLEAMIYYDEYLPRVIDNVVSTSIVKDGTLLRQLRNKVYCTTVIKWMMWILDVNIRKDAIRLYLDMRIE